MVTLNPGTLQCTVNLRDCGKMKYQDYNRCANCYLEIKDPASSRVKLKEKLDNGGRQSSELEDFVSSGFDDLTLMDALDLVFDLHKNSYRSGIIPDENYCLCPTCLYVFKDMFVSFSNFCNMSGSCSFLYDFAGRKSTGSSSFQAEIFPMAQVKTELLSDEDLSDAEGLLELFPEAADDYGDEDFSRASNDVEGNPFPSAGIQPILKTPVRRNTRVKFSLAEEESDDGEVQEVEPMKLNNDDDYVPMDDDSDPDFATRGKKKTQKLKSQSRGRGRPRIKKMKVEASSENLDSNSNLSSPSKSTAPSPLRPRIHMCTICSIGFSRTNHLKEHMLRHAEKNVTCDCGAYFTKNKFLRLHKKRDCRLGVTKDEPEVKPKPKTKAKAKEAAKGEPDSSLGPNEGQTEASTGLDECEPDAATGPNEGQTELSSEQKEFKRGRGRPRKDAPKVPTAPKMKRIFKNAPRARSHVCTVCSIGFTRSNHLKRHLLQHSVELVTCECGIPFNSEQNLKFHQKFNCKQRESENILSEEQISDNLSKAVVNMNRIRAHQLVKNALLSKPVRVYTIKTCSIPGCGKKFTRSYRLRNHEELHLMKPFMCEHCRRCYKEEDQLKKHLEISCRVLLGLVGPEPDISSGEAEGETKEERTKSNNNLKRYACHCGQAFSRTNHLLTHMKVHREKNCICTVCGAGFVNQTRLTSHSFVHDPDYVPPEKDVLRRFVNAEGEVVHVDLSKIVPRKDVPKGYRDEVIPCPVCEKPYARKNLPPHLLIHSDTTPYICEQCGKAFKTATNLQAHQKVTHSTERPYLCKHCGASFKRRNHLTDHELVHTDARAFACKVPECGKTFNSRRNLRQHVRLHDGLKYSCKSCGNTFNRSDNLRAHMRSNCHFRPGVTEKTRKRGKNRKKKGNGDRGDQDNVSPPTDPRNPPHPVLPDLEPQKEEYIPNSGSSIPAELLPSQIPGHSHPTPSDGTPTPTSSSFASRPWSNNWNHFLSALPSRNELSNFLLHPQSQLTPANDSHLPQLNPNSSLSHNNSPHSGGQDYSSS